MLGATINHYCYITARYLPPFFKHKHRVVYSKIESVMNPDEILHPAVREAIKFMNFDAGLEIHHDGDLPKQTGLGTSSAFAVGLLHSLHALHGNMVTPMQLAKEAIHLERNLCKETVGSQDQVLAAHGGLLHIKFLPDNVIRVAPVTAKRERIKELESHIMLVFTGFSRFASEIAQEQIRNISQKKTELGEMQKLVAEGMRVLSGTAPITEFGSLLHENWMLKRSLSSKVSSPEIDTLYDKARDAGAIGGKLCGAGGGGFMMLFVEPDKQASLLQNLDGFLNVPFEFEWNGSQIIFFNPNKKPLS